MRYQIRHAIVRYAADTILEDVNFEIHDTEKIAIVGRNGCGKTTFLKLISGEIKMDNLDSDEECGIIMAGEQRIGFLRQISFLDTEITVEKEIEKVFAPIFACEKRMEEITESGGSEEDSTSSLWKEYARLQAKMDALRGYTWRQDMEIVFQRYGFSLEDLQRPIGTLSGGQQTKIAFIKLLLSRPDIMLLDEPTNHLDMSTIEWLEGYLKNYDGAVVLVSHDRMFLDHVVDVTYEIEYHQMKRYSGNYSSFMRQKEEAAQKQQKDYEEQQKEIKRLTDWIEKWKNTPTKVSAVWSKQKAIEHMVPVEKPRRFDLKGFHGQFLPRTQSYTNVLIAKGLQIGYDTVLAKLSFTLQKGQRLAVIGPNGKGKSTLLKTIIGKLDRLGGSFQLGTGVEWGYFDQQAAVERNIDPEMTVLDDFWNVYPKMKEVEVRNALGSFLFSQEEVFKKMGQLSGGEKVRLELCKMFMKRPNLLILDEPTNHMDIVGKDALEKMLCAYTGTVLFVSHDRYFIRHVATCILDLGQEKNSLFAGGYEEYLAENTGKALPEGGKKDAQKERPSGRKEKSTPTLDNVFDKKTYYNPGKILSRLKQQKLKYEKMLAESEEHLSLLQMQLMEPELASDYSKLTDIQNQIDMEESQQESLLERLVETEQELFEREGGEG